MDGVMDGVMVYNLFECVGDGYTWWGEEFIGTFATRGDAEAAIELIIEARPVSDSGGERHPRTADDYVIRDVIVGLLPAEHVVGRC